MTPDPFGELGCGAARVELDFVPVGVLEELGVREAEFLGAGVSDEPEADMCANRLGDFLPAANLQTRCYRDGVLDGLGGSVAGGWEV